MATMQNPKMRQVEHGVLLRRVLPLLLLLCLVFGGVALVIHHWVERNTPTVDLDAYQAEMLEELQQREGEYDAQSIMLTGTTPVAAKQLAELLGAELRITAGGSFATLTLPEDVTLLDVCQNDAYLEFLPQMSIDYQASISDLLVEEDGAEENGEHVPARPQYAVTDASYALQTYLDYLNLRTVWYQTQGSGLTVAVIDTGIDTDHPEFAGRISEYSYNATEDKIVKDYLLADGSYDWSLIEDEQGHGTAVAGVIGASMNSGHVVGVAPEVTLLVIKAECDEDGMFKRTSDLVFGLYYAIERDVSVVNMSFGGPSNPYAEPAQLAADSDILCVAAAGNEATTALTYPAADENVLGVGALGADSWELAGYSNYGENVDLVAPGTTYTTLLGGEYGTMNGTSLACPAAAGAIALLRSQNQSSEYGEIRELIYASCYDLGELGHDWYYGYGAIDVSAMILEEKGKITFNMMTDELENVEQVFIRNHTLQSIPEPERLYAVFDGWYYDPQCTEEYNRYSDEFSADLTLYAGWVNEDDGVPFTYVELEDGTIEIRSYTGHRRYIVVPDRIDGKIVSSIGAGAFAGQTRLREVILPKQLKYIQDAAFATCNNLLHIDIPDTVVSIGAAAFSDNVRLSYIAFGDNSQLMSVGQEAFKNCFKLQRFELPAGLTKLDGSAFLGASNLIAFSVRAGNTAFSVQEGVLFDSSKTTLVCYPAGLRGEYTMPEGIREIGTCAFAMSRITTIDLTGVQSIKENAFWGSKLQSVAIPDSVTEMGISAFSRNFDLAEVTLGNGLTRISDLAFYDCWALTSVEIPASVHSMGKNAFANTFSLATLTFAENSQLTLIDSGSFFSSGLVAVTFPRTLISIGMYAFANTPLTSVDFGEESQLTRIDEFAFYQTMLQTVTIPASVTMLNTGAFGACPALTDITVAAGNTTYEDVDGVVYNQAITEIIAYPAGNVRTEYTVEGTVTAIGENAFCGAQNLNNVSLPDGLQSIRRQAFYGCSGLWSMMIPDSVMQIEAEAFAGCWSLSSVYLSDNSCLPRISYGAFSNCGLTSFRAPANVSTIAQGAFAGCRNMTSFTFAANSRLSGISAYMFDGCDSLQSITFESGSALTSIQAHGLEGMRALTSIDFGDAKVTNIDNFAFRFCESLTSIVIPEGVTSIGRFAFYYCDGLTDVTLPASLEHIGRFAFLGADHVNLYFASSTMPPELDEDWDYGIRSYYLGVTDVSETEEWKYATTSDGGIALLEYKGSATTLDLSGLNLGGSITNIGGRAFAFSSVESMILPNTLVTIQAEAFLHSALKSVTVPASVEFIGREAFAYTPIEDLCFAADGKLTVIEASAFEGTEALKSVTLPASLKTLGRAAFQKSGITSLTFASGIALTEIPEQAFAYTGIETLTIPNSVTLIDHHAFRNTASLESVTWGSADFMVMSNAFYQSGLKSLTIPKNMIYIGEYAFVGLPNLTAFRVDAANPFYKTIDGLLTDVAGRKLIAVPAGRTGTLTVPAGIEVIGFGAFEDSRMTGVSFLPDANILSFGYRAFYGSAITEMHVPASVVAIDYYAFADCRDLTRVTFAEDNQLRGIYEGAFYGCKSLSDITIPDSIVEISDFAFYGCNALDKLPISETSGVKGIYDYAFAYTGIRELTVPETLYDIGSYAFMGLRVREITVPDINAQNLVIGLGAFADCQNLEEITLPFIGASFEDTKITWFGYIFGAGGYEANPTYVPESLRKVTITEGITVIGASAFYNLSRIEEMSIPHSVTVIDINDPYGRGAFEGTTAKYELTNTILPINREYDVEKGDYVQTYTVKQYLFGSGLCGQLTLAEGVTSIDSFGFADCWHLTDITLPSSVKSIGWYAFYACRSLTDIVIPNNVITIGYRAFDGCESLASITLPNALTVIEDEAFAGCRRLVLVCNNSDLTLTIGSGAHGGVAYHAWMIVDKYGNKTYGDPPSGMEYTATEDGFLFEKENGEYRLIAYLGTEDTVTLPADINGNSYKIQGLQGVRNVILPAGMTSIDAYAFSNCTDLISIVIPEGVTSIGDNAFQNCGQLTAVKIPDSVTSIGYAAFYGCSSLTSITIPDSMTSLKNGTFSDCSSLTDIQLPNSLMSIEGAFSGCSALTDIVIPDGVTEIYPHAFAGCSSLQTVTIGKGVQTIGDSAFAGCPIENIYLSAENAHFVLRDGILYDKRMTAVKFASKNITTASVPEGVLELSGSAFDGCSDLQSVSLPSSLLMIGAHAFRGCESLTDIQIPEGITSLDQGTFAGCKRLEHIVLPDSVTYIGYLAFEGCERLGSINVPAGLTDVDFSECKGLTSITFTKGVRSISLVNCTRLTSLEIPDGVEGVNLSGCSSLASLTLPDSVAQLNLSGCSALTEVTIPNRVTSIEHGAFSGCSSLESITIPDSVTSIGGNAFSGCSSLKSITIPERVTSIGDGAFSDCSSLTSMTVPDGVTVIDSSAFAGCSNLASITLPENVTFFGDGMFNGCRSLRAVKIPNGVTSIGEYTFTACGSLTDITIPNGVTSIGNNAFNNCSGMISITIPDSVRSIDLGAFSGCGGLAVIYNNSELAFTIGSEEHGGIAANAKLIVDKNGDKTYREGVSSWEYVDTADGFRFIKENGSYRLVEYFGDEDIVTLPGDIHGNPYEIYRMRGVRNVILPEGMTSIGDYAFSYCSHLESIVIPDSVTSIGRYAFESCGRLTSIMIGNGVTSIGDSAFWDCSSLVSFTIPGKVTSIGGCAFMNCHNLAGITISSSVASIGERAFLSTALYNDPSNWEDGLLVIDGCLIDVKENVDRIMRRDIRLIADRALEECYRLHTMTICGESFWTLGTLTNLETLIITDLPQSIANYFGGSVSALPMTLKNIVLADGVKMHDTAFYDLSGNPITGVTIFVEETEQDTMWEENFPGWNVGNRVVYGDNWVYADFYGANGTFAGGGIFRTSQVIRMPYIKDYTDGVYRYVFEGFDLDGDGVVDAIPATSRVDIAAQAIFTASCLHTSSSWVVEQAPTCMADGYGYRVCDHCGEKLEKKTIAAKGHTFGDWVLTAQPTCTEQGIETRFCACGHSDTRSVPALGHTEEILPAISPTCTEAGLTEGKRCAVCGEILEAQKTVAAQGHTFGDWVLTAQPTCTEQGTETRFCACGHSETRSVPALGHTFGEYISNNDATADADGTKTAVCERCEATDTTVDEGSAFGYAGKFEEAVAALNAGDPADRHYTALREALLLWESLSEEEKAEVAEAYAALSAMVDAYNAKVETANQAMEDATEIAFAPLIGSFAFLAALWEILKKRLYL